ncbi:MAG TPA: serine protease, partial [Actinomycetota bacterium]|nr:serine protease [Actinomycetota bacterium]
MIGLRGVRMRLSFLSVLLVATAWAMPSGAFADTLPRTWAPASTAAIHPGVQTVTGAGQCTSNFVFFDATDVYLGQAAHCSSTGQATDVDGCTSPSLPLGTSVQVDGASQPGTMVYNSWLTMQESGETDPDTCLYNDFALIRLDPADHSKVNPSIPHWGGPTGINTTGTVANQRVYSYGNSSLRLGLEELSPKVGLSQGDRGGGWSHVVLTFTPGIPGDS